MRIRKIKPKKGEESVWDYPRPPRLEESYKHIQVIFNDELIAETSRSRRVLETSHPPVYYICPEDINTEYLQQASGTSLCEWKGQALYYSILVNGVKSEKAGWFYPAPTSGFESIRDYVAFYPGRVDACFIDGEKVTPQPGDFYGGWITRDIVGPFKGEPGTWGW